MVITDLIKRHGAAHFANVKYGYIVLLLSLIHIAYIYFSRRVYFKKWITTGRATSYKRLVSTPDTALLIAWAVIILALSWYHFKLEAVNSFIKRLGRIGYVLVTLDIFVSLKPNPLPNVYYLELIFLHKWLSRLLVLWTLGHSIGYTSVWIQSNTFSKIFRVLNFLGVIAMSLFLLSTIVSLKPIRRRFYKFFFTTHLIIAWLVVGLIHYHARPGVALYTFLNASLFILQIAVKIWKSRDVVIDKTTASGSTLELITIPNYFINQFPAGSHVRISLPRANILTYLLPSHPYTIASLPDETSIKLVVRMNNHNLKTHQIVSCFGPFPSIHENFYKTAENVVLIAGGAGISYTLGLYQQLSRNSSIKISMIWIMRNKADTWILDHFNIRAIDIYITGKSLTSDDPQDSSSITSPAAATTTSRFDDMDEDEQLLDNFSSDEYEMETIDPFNEATGAAKPNRTIKLGRPHMGSYSNLLTQDDKANNWVVSCGSGTLNKDCKRWAEALGVRYHYEAYDM